MLKLWIYYFLFLFLLSCSPTVREGQATRPQTTQEVVSAAGTVVEGLTGKDVDEKDLQDLARQLQRDEDARSAVESISESLSGSQQIKYCPITGKRYSPKLKVCPIHGVELKILEE